MQDYQMVLITKPGTAEEDLSATIEKVSRFITEKGGAIAEVEQWGRRRLAYPIKHFMEGDYVLTQFKLEPKLMAELEANLRLSEDILRYLMVRLGD